MTELKRRGRPTKAPKDGDRVSLGLRVTADLKRRLDDAAAISGRSQSQEAEMRLARSFSDDAVTDLLTEAVKRISALEAQQIANEDRIAMAVTRELVRSGRMVFMDAKGRPMKSGFIDPEDGS